MIWLVLAQGYALGFSLIVAIGAQNAFVLRQGLRREHVATVVLLCALADALLISAGVFGMAQALDGSPGLATGLTLLGSAFLAWYGAQALLRLRQSEQLVVEQRGGSVSRGQVIAQTAAFTLLNPHVYLDTVLLAGSIGAAQPAALQGWFVVGAAGASATWFSGLGFGAKWLAPWFEHPRAWQILDGIIGVTMWVLAIAMLRYVWH